MPDREEWDRFSHELLGAIYEQSDRSAGIIAGCLIENLLEDLLRTNLRKGKETDWLLDRIGPLGAHGPRIRLARALNLVDDRVYADLIAINDIRNTFAHNAHLPDNHHNHHIATFDSPKIAGKCANLTLYNDSPSADNTPRALFMRSIMVLAHQLVGQPLYQNTKLMSEALKHQFEKHQG
jgi:hypothetical protein